MSRIADQFLGTAAEYYVASRLLARGWNIQDPGVDQGTDLFATSADRTNVTRVQVKTSRADPHDYGYSFRVSVHDAMLESPTQPRLIYVFVVRLERRWGPTVVIPQTDLHDLVANDEVGYAGNRGHTLELALHGDGLQIDRVRPAGAELDLTEYLNDLSHWPPVYE